MRTPLIAESLFAKLGFPLALALVVAGCGGNVVVDSGDGSGGGSSSHPPSQFGTPQASCDIKEGGLELCEQIFHATPTIVNELHQSCSVSHGKEVAACSSVGVSGCCVVTIAGASLEECVYASSPQQVQMLCEQQHGKFTSSP